MLIISFFSLHQLNDEGQFMMRDIHKTFEALPTQMLMPLVHLGDELEKVSQKQWRMKGK